MVVLMVRRAWPLVVPHTALAAGLYIALLLIATLGGIGRLQAGLAGWGMAWCQRMRGDQPLTAQGEALLILLGFTLSRADVAVR
jgi:hypothetical protein